MAVSPQYTGALQAYENMLRQLGLDDRGISRKMANIDSDRALFTNLGNLALNHDPSAQSYFQMYGGGGGDRLDQNYGDEFRRNYGQALAEGLTGQEALQSAQGRTGQNIQGVQSELAYQNRQGGMGGWWEGLLEDVVAPEHMGIASMLGTAAMLGGGGLDIGGYLGDTWNIGSQLGANIGGQGINALMGGDVNTQSLGRSAVGGLGQMGGLGDFGEFFQENPWAGDALSYGLTGQIPSSIYGNLPGDIGGFFQENPWAGNLVNYLLPDQSGGGLDLSGLFGGGGLDLSGIFGNIFGEDGLDLSGIFGNLFGEGKTDDFLRSIGIPIALGYLSREQSQPWENQFRDSLTGMSNIAQGMQGQYNKYFGGGWDWGDPTQTANVSNMGALDVNQLLTQQPPITTTQQPLPQEYAGADINKDYKLDLSDLLALKQQVGQTGAGLTADITGDQKIDLRDLLELKKAIDQYGAGGYQTGQEQAGGGTAYQPNIPPVQPPAEATPSVGGIDPYQQAVKMLGYGMMNPLGASETQARLGQMYDQQAGETAQMIEVARQNAAARGQNPDPRMNPALAAQIQQIESNASLGRQGMQRDIFTYGQDLQRDYTTNLLSALQPMLGQGSQAASIYGSTLAPLVGQIGNIQDQWAGLGESIATAQSPQYDPMEMANYFLNLMGQQGGGQQQGGGMNMGGGGSSQQYGDLGNVLAGLLGLGGGSQGGTGGGFSDFWGGLMDQVYQQPAPVQGTTPYGPPNQEGVVTDPNSWGYNWTKYGQTSNKNKY